MRIVCVCAHNAYQNENAARDCAQTMQRGHVASLERTNLSCALLASQSIMPVVLSWVHVCAHTGGLACSLFRSPCCKITKPHVLSSDNTFSSYCPNIAREESRSFVSSLRRCSRGRHRTVTAWHFAHCTPSSSHNDNIANCSTA